MNDVTARARRESASPPLALGPLMLVAALLALVLLVFAGGYGYHRDELYFLVAGRHLAWAYPDQGPVTPLLAHVMDAIGPGSLTVLRTPSALMAGATALFTGLICFELGGGRRAQLIAAACAGVASVVLVTGHLLSTSTLDLLAWSLVSWLIVRALRTGHEPLWLAAGAVGGIALLNKPLIAFFGLALGIGLLIAGPRDALRQPWPWVGLLIALALWSPWLIWQGSHDWPQLKVSSAIASGGSGSSQPRWALLPFQFLLVSPVLAPVWIAGLLALARDLQLRTYRFFAGAWVVLVVIFLATGGKPYYLAGMFPVLLAAGAIRTDAWLMHGRSGLRRALLVAAIGLSGVVSAVIALPILPEGSAGPVVAVNGDIGETIGWPQFTRLVARAYRQTGRPAVILTSNYGEAGAIDRFGGPLGLPRAYSGHNGFAEWGPPPDRASPIVVVGFTQAHLQRHFVRCHLAVRVSNSAGIDNDEHDEPIDVCDATRGPWSRIWRGLRRLG